MFIVFDTETTGLPKNWKAKITDLDNWPRVIQISWAVYSLEFELIKKETVLIKPDGWIIKDLKYWQDKGFTKEQVLSSKDMKFWAENGYTNEENEELGEPMQDVLNRFLDDYNKCIYMVAHNISYDFNVLGAEMLRYNMRASKRIFKICTMHSTTLFVKAPSQNKYSIYKWPTLTELHTKLFNTGFDGAHDAGADVEATAKCLFKLLEMEVILLPVIKDNEVKYISHTNVLRTIEMQSLKSLVRPPGNIENIDHFNKDFKDE